MKVIEMLVKRVCVHTPWCLVTGGRWYSSDWWSAWERHSWSRGT